MQVLLLLPPPLLLLPPPPPLLLPHPLSDPEAGGEGLEISALPVTALITGRSEHNRISVSITQPHIGLNNCVWPYRENLAASTIVGAFAVSTLVPALALLLHNSLGMSSRTFFSSW